MSYLKSKVQRFDVPHSSLAFNVQVFEDTRFVAYPILPNGENDYANTIDNISEIPAKIRDAVELYLKKCMEDFQADRIKFS